MSRINIYRTDEFTGEQALEGWFDMDSAIRFDQDTEWDGNNMIGVITRSQWVDEYLFRTKGGRWVLNHNARRHYNGPDTYKFITDEQARDWLIRSQCNDKAIEEYFGPVEEERGPGRPEVGPAVNMRFPQDLLDRIDAAAKTDGISRAEKIRRLVAAGLS